MRTEKITNYALINVVSILNQVGAKKMPQKIAYAVTRNRMMLDTACKCYNESLEKLYQVYKDYIKCDENGDQVFEHGSPVFIDGAEDKAKEFQGELKDLLNIEIEIDLYEIPFEYFDYDDHEGKYDVLTSNELISLQSILCEKDVKEDKKE